MINSTTFNEDCIAGMKRYPDKWFDLAVVDPPYGIGADNVVEGRKKRAHNGWKNYGIKSWDNQPPDRKYFKELKRVSKNQIIWGANHFVENIPDANSSCWVIWDKGQRDFSLADGEMAWASFNKAVRIKTINRGTSNAEIRIHPTQKPIALYDWIFKSHAQPTDKILDTHLGSQSSRIAADKAGLDFTGFEIDKEYYDMGEKRYKQYKAQLRLW